MPAGPDNLVVRALAAVGRRASVRLGQAHPRGSRVGRRIVRCCRHPALGRLSRSERRRPARRRRSLLPGRWPSGGEWHRRGRESACPIGTSTSSSFWPPSASTPLPSTGPGTSWPPSGAGTQHRRAAMQRAGNDLEAAALRVEPRLASWRDALARATGQRPRLAGSGSTWFVEGPLESLGLEPGSCGLEGARARWCRPAPCPGGGGRTATRTPL